MGSGTWGVKRGRSAVCGVVRTGLFSSLPWAVNLFCGCREGSSDGLMGVYGWSCWALVYGVGCPVISSLLGFIVVQTMPHGGDVWTGLDVPLLGVRSA